MRSMVVNAGAYQHHLSGEEVKERYLKDKKPEYLVIGPPDLHQTVQQEFIDRNPDKDKYKWVYYDTDTLRAQVHVEHKVNLSSYILEKLQKFYQYSHLSHVLFIGDDLEIPYYAQPGTGVFGTDYTDNMAMEIYGWLKFDPANPYYLVDCGGWCRFVIGTNPEVPAGMNTAEAWEDWPGMNMPNVRLNIVGKHYTPVQAPFRTPLTLEPPYDEDGSLPREHTAWTRVISMPFGPWNYNAFLDTGGNWWLPFDLKLINYRGSLDIKVMNGPVAPDWTGHGASQPYHEIEPGDIAIRDTANSMVPEKYHVWINWLDRLLAEFRGKISDTPYQGTTIGEFIADRAFKAPFNVPPITRVVELDNWTAVPDYLFGVPKQDPPPHDYWGFAWGSVPKPLHFCQKRTEGDYLYSTLNRVPKDYREQLPLISIARLPVFTRRSEKFLTRQEQLRNAFAKIMAYQTGTRVHVDNGNLEFRGVPGFGRLASRVLLLARPTNALNPISAVADAEKMKSVSWGVPLFSRRYLSMPEFVYDYGYEINEYMDQDGNRRKGVFGLDPDIGNGILFAVSAMTNSPFSGTRKVSSGVGLVYSFSHMSPYFGGYIQDNLVTLGTYWANQQVYPIAGFGGCEPAGISHVPFPEQTLVYNEIFFRPDAGMSQFTGARRSTSGSPPIMKRFLAFDKDFGGAPAALLWRFAARFPDDAGFYEYNQAVKGYNNPWRNALEWMVFGTPDMPAAPLSDTDGDGMYGDVLFGEKDLCPNVTDPTNKDSDGDGIGDACDLCPDTKDPDQEVSRVQWAFWNQRWFVDGSACSDPVPRLVKAEPQQDLKPLPLPPQCQLRIPGKFRKDLWYRVKVVYNWQGMAHEGCELRGSFEPLTIAYDNDSTAVTSYSGQGLPQHPEIPWELMPHTTVWLMKADREDSLCINAHSPFYAVCPDVHVGRVSIVPDGSYIFTHEDTKEKWTGPERRITSLTGKNEIPLGMVGVVHGHTGLDGLQGMSLECTDNAGSIAACNDDNAGNDLVLWTGQQGDGTTWTGSLRDQAHGFDLVCPVALDAMLKGGRRYQVEIPYYTRRQPWYDDPDEITTYSGRGRYVKRSRISRFVQVRMPGDQSARISFPLGNGYPDMVNKVRVGTVRFDLPVDADGAVLYFCQSGDGEYYVDNVVIMDKGPVSK